VSARSKLPVPTPTPHELQAARNRLGLTRLEFATRLNVYVRTLDGWEYHGVRPPSCLAIALKHILEEANHG
jgi:DNA-binding transcriptional regulator YiaG